MKELPSANELEDLAGNSAPRQKVISLLHAMRNASGSSAGTPSDAETVSHFAIAQQRPVPALQDGTVLGGKLHILGLLDTGGMGEVYVAWHDVFECEVAVKVLPLDMSRDADAVARFRKGVKAQFEAGAHHHIVTTLDAGEEQGRLYLVMQYVSGTSLAQYVHDGGRLGWPEASDCIRQAALGLAYAHDRGVVHRDIKPSNLMRQPDGSIRILDWGLAACSKTPAGGQDDRTASGTMMGTYDYVSPEQARDAATAGPTSDLYSLGATLYFLLAGHPPFAGSAEQKLLCHATEPPPPIRALRPELPIAADEILSRLLAKRPEERFGSAAELIEALDATDYSLRGYGRAGVRWLALAALCSLLLGGAWYARKPGVQPTTGNPSAAASATTLKLEQYRLSGKGDELTHLGSIGLTKEAQYLGDRIVVEATFGDPLFAYLLAINPDGSTEWLYPEVDALAPPERSDALICPVGTGYFTLDKVGFVGFVLVGAREPFPDRSLPRAERQIWSNFSRSSTWVFDGTRLRPAAYERISKVEHGPSALDEFCRQLKQRPQVATVRAVAFPVVSPAVETEP